MLKLDSTETEIEQLYREFMGHPSGPAKKKLHVVYLKLKALGLPHQVVFASRGCRDSVTHYLKVLPMAVGPALCTLHFAIAPGNAQNTVSSLSAAFRHLSFT